MIQYIQDSKPLHPINIWNDNIDNEINDLSLAIPINDLIHNTNIKLVGT